MNESILVSIKHLLGVLADDTSFDQDILANVNAALSTLTQIGIGPEYGLLVEGEQTKWTEFVSEIAEYQAAKMYVYTRTRLAFDPPTNSFVVNELRNQMEEYHWRLSIMAEQKRIARESV